MAQNDSKSESPDLLRYLWLSVPILTLVLAGYVALRMLFSGAAASGSAVEPFVLGLLLVLAALACIRLLSQARVPALKVNPVQDADTAAPDYSLLLDFFENNPEIMFIKSLDGSFYNANKKCRLLEGKGDANLEGVDRSEGVIEAVAARMQEQDLQVLLNEEPMEFHTPWSLRGKTRHFKSLRFPMWDASGDIVAIGGMASDVTDQVNSRHALLDQEQLLKTFIESAPDVVLICDADGQIILTNKQTSSVFGYDREEILQLSIFDLIPELDLRLLNELFEDASALEGEVFRVAMDSQGVRKSNRNFPAEFSLAPITTKEGSLVICLLRDVTDRAIMETQLRQSQKMDAIGKLTGGMAHDFNNLLGIIIGNLDLSLAKVKDNEKLTKRLTSALQAADRGADLTKRMLAVARRQPLQPKSIDLNGIVEEMSKILPATLGPHIEMEVDLKEGLPPALVDASGLEGVLLNLAINARDAMPDGGKFCVKTDTEGREEILSRMPDIKVWSENYIHITVADTGTGMSKETLNRAFEPFYSTKDKSKGTGLGLSMIYGFVKQSRGYILLDSELGKGTTIEIYLPVAEKQERVRPAGAGETATRLLSEGNIRVLVVDDESSLLEIATTYLEDLGCKVLTASSGKHGLQVLREHPEVDILLTDIVMPGGMNGVTFANQARNFRPDLKVIYTSGFPSGVIEENAHANLDAPLVNKPYSRDSLGNMIREVLEEASEAAG